jgi:superoxide dismutase
MPPLPYDFRAGVPGFLSADGFQMAWTDYMTVMIDKLNGLTAGMASTYILLHSRFQLQSLVWMWNWLMIASRSVQHSLHSSNHRHGT